MDASEYLRASSKDKKVKREKIGARREARVRPASRPEAPAPGEETPCSEGPSEPSSETGGEGGRLAGGDSAGLEGGEGGTLTGEGPAGDIPAGRGSNAPERREKENEERKGSTHHHTRNGNHIGNGIPEQEETVSAMEEGTPDAETIPERGEADEAGRQTKTRRRGRVMSEE